jgi:hypothetical protein
MARRNYNIDEFLCTDSGPILAAMARRRMNASEIARRLGCASQTVRRAIDDPISSPLSIYVALAAGASLDEVFQLKRSVEPE